MMFLIQRHVSLLSMLVIGATILSLVHGFSAPSSPADLKKSIVVYGPQSKELLLLVSKLAAQQGYTASCICAPGTEEGCRRLMYGPEYAEAAQDVEGNAKPISEPTDMGAALEQANALVLINYDEAVEGPSLETFLKYTTKEQLQKVVLLSKMGVTKAKKGFFGGGMDTRLGQAEQDIAKILQNYNPNVPLSIIRAGIVKGGGPGLDDEGNPLQADSSLHKCYYTTYLDVVEYKVTLAHDKFSLGADANSIVAGDPHSLPNMVTQMGTKSSFDPSATDTNRIVAASAAVAALQYDDPIEISIGVAAGRELPSPSAWMDLFAQFKAAAVP